MASVSNNETAKENKNINSNKFKNEINQYDYILACTIKYNIEVAEAKQPNIKDIVNSLANKPKEILKYKDLYLQNKQNGSIHENNNDNTQINFNNNRYFPKTDGCTDVRYV